MSESDQGSNRSRAPRRPEPSAYQRALGLLVRREHSRHELARKLQARGVAADEAEAALATLAKQDFQNDARFAEALVRNRAAAGYGPLRVRAELAAHGFSRIEAEAALRAVAPNWMSRALALVGRRFSRLAEDPVQRRKAVDFLLRRGFDRSLAFAAAGRGGPHEDAEA